jgi:hypothetical protein
MLNPDEIYTKVLAAGESWADLKGAYEALHDNTNTVLADLTANFMDSAKMTRAEAEMRAEASGEFKTHNATKSAARKAYYRAQVAYDCLKMLADLRRSEESTRRQEMKI